MKIGDRPIYVDREEQSTKVQDSVDALRAMIRFSLSKSADKFKVAMKSIRETTVARNINGLGT